MLIQMIHIDRLPIPAILQEKQVEWQEKYDSKLETDPKARPDSSKYAHKQIKDTLYAMSNGKCFYCETMLSGVNKEVDHFIEVAIDHSKAYTWENLYLACTNCNDKLDNNAIPVTEVLDPCKDSDEEIQRHITFVEEQICALNGSGKGLKSIKKYKLNSDLLDLRRGRWLNHLKNEAITIQERMIAEGRNTTTEAERNTILRYMSPDQPYSLMCEVYIKRYLGRLISSELLVS
jgi:uncharacterized protein (TIGR02646 family)